MDLLGQGNPHWAGNINVFVGRTAVERHVAQSLRIYPGRNNHAMLIVGDRRHDAYSFSLRGDGAVWDSQLSAVSVTPRKFSGIPFEPIKLDQWHDVTGLYIVQLAIRPPVACERGEVQVHITRQSAKETAIVEFSLDASAQGPGCYAM